MEQSSWFEKILPTLEEGSTQAVYVGLHWAAVVVTVNGQRRCGLASISVNQPSQNSQDTGVEKAGSLNQIPAKELVQWFNSPNSTETSIGLATINALLPRMSGLGQEINAEEVIIKYGKGKNIAIVGHFPFVPHVKSEAKNLWVLELNPKPGDLPASAANEMIPQADVVAITSMTLINRTFDHLISLPKKEAIVLLLGPTTPLSPVLFDFGIDILSGAIVENIEKVICGLTQGASFQLLHQMGVRLVSIQKGEKNSL